MRVLRKRRFESLRRRAYDHSNRTGSTEYISPKEYSHSIRRFKVVPAVLGKCRKMIASADPFEEAPWRIVNSRGLSLVRSVLELIGAAGICLRRLTSSCILHSRVLSLPATLWRPGMRSQD